MTEPLRRCLFLDRDGVVNVDNGYIHEITHFKFVDGIFDLCRAAIQEDMLVIIVTNQSGIGRGLFSDAQFQILNSWMMSRFLDERIEIAAVYYCPFHPQYGVGDFKRNSFNRKPNPGMILQARYDFHIDLPRSVLLGDKNSDILAGKHAGVGLNILLNEKAVNAELADFVVSNLKGNLPMIRELLYFNAGEKPTNR